MNKFRYFIAYSILSSMFALVGIVFLIGYAHSIFIDSSMPVMALVPLFLLIMSAFAGCVGTGMMAIHFFLSWRKEHV
jgi:K+-transporting ATPase A subunit